MSFRKVKVLICGSCVSRDALNPDFLGTSSFEVAEYVARSSLATAFSEGEVTDVAFDAIESPFQRRMVTSDVKHGLKDTLKNTDYDLLLVDMIDERFDLFMSSDGSVCTISNELLSSGFDAGTRAGQVIKSASDAFFELWERGWAAFVRHLGASGGLSKLYINKVFWASSVVDNSDFLPSYSARDIERANAFLNRLYARMEEDIPRDQFINFWNGAVFQAKQNHRWGKSPFHYVDDYYTALLGRLDDIRERLFGKADVHQSYVMISVDVEALPGRATEDHVNRLIYGKYDGGEHGISRLCDIFAERQLKATFFVDFACCCLHGDDGIFGAARYLRDRGHDVQLHMHSEVYVRKLLPQLRVDDFPSFEALSYDVAKEIIAYGVDKFESAVGYRPSIFRPGGMKKNDVMYRACKDLGLHAVSATYRGYDGKRWNALGDESVAEFAFDTLEIPLDQALDPLVPSDKFEPTLTALLKTKGLVSYLIHSRSLLYRDPSESTAKFTHHSAEYEKTLCGYLDILAQHAKFITHSDLLAMTGGAAPAIESGFVREYQSPKKIVLEQTVGTEDFKFSHLNDEQIADPNDFVSPTVIPVRLSGGQGFRVMEISSASGEIRHLPYVISGTNLYVQTDRIPLPFLFSVEKMSEVLRSFNPSVKVVIFGRVAIEASVDTTPRGAGFILDVPGTVDEYYGSIISSNLLSEIRRERRRMLEDVDKYELLIVERGNISRQLLRYARQLTDESLLAKGQTLAEPISEQWVETFLPYYQKHGRIALCRKNGVEIAAALAYEFDRDMYLMSSGFFQERSRYGIGKHIFLKLAECAIDSGLRRFCLGGGDFGYKSRMGAMEYPFFSIKHTFS